MKRRLVTAILLILAVLTGLCSCGGEGKPEEKIKDEIAEAYELDDAGKKLVHDLFAEFDSAFERLKESKLEDRDLYDYAEAITTAFSDFDHVFSEKYSSKLQEKIDNASGDELSEYVLISTDYRFKAIDINYSKFSFLEGYDGGSGERLAEEAFNYVNELSDFFCGIYRITDDELDELAKMR